jgi:histone H3/H4|tara:strand:+ start:2308 stop:2451 length:144 start_codon:yes stop_codon:yes gene_type:complete
MAKIEGRPINVSGDFYTALDEKVQKIVEDACKRAKLNNRNTVMGKDV